jgi:hypothetical protein
VCGSLDHMAGDLTIRLRRIGERRTWPIRRLRAEYEVLIHDGESEPYRARTTAPSAALVAKGKVHTTDSYDWVRAADEAYERHDATWISDPFAADH